MGETGYSPNLAARTLASGRSGVVGVVIHVPPDLLFQDIFFSGLFHGIAEALAQRGAGMMLWLANLSKEQTLERILGMRLFDGLIVTADMLDDPLVDGLVHSSLPTVLVGHRHRDRSASYVDIDNERAAEQITDHLISLGRRRVGHITGRRGGVSAEERLTGYRRAMKRAGLATDGLVADGDYLARSGEAGAETLLAAGVDAIFCASDTMAFGALRTLERHGAAVPDDVAVAGFDDLPQAAEAVAATDDHAPGHRPTRYRGRARPLPPAQRQGRRTPARDPADGAGHPPVHRRRPGKPMRPPTSTHQPPRRRDAPGETSVDVRPPDQGWTPGGEIRT